jgi:hypothetical protein
MFLTKVVEKFSKILCTIIFLVENRTVYEIMWKNIVQPGKPQMTTYRRRIALWVSKTTNTHSEYVKLIAFPLQQWLRECASMLRVTHVGCRVLNLSMPRTRYLLKH